LYKDRNIHDIRIERSKDEGEKDTRIPGCKNIKG
jgi:hypothetical protein